MPSWKKSRDTFAWVGGWLVILCVPVQAGTSSLYHGAGQGTGETPREALCAASRPEFTGEHGLRIPATRAACGFEDHIVRKIEDSPELQPDGRIRESEEDLGSGL